ncbi:hypothetical protein CEB3_c32800 [Peptococcaceae bacterium CEB3]|nr:hypothetical protein CEB3_c32800 [Peptococcaceae bacterium CEB3]
MHCGRSGKLSSARETPDGAFLVARKFAWQEVFQRRRTKMIAEKGFLRVGSENSKMDSRPLCLLSLREETRNV